MNLSLLSQVCKKCLFINCGNWILDLSSCSSRLEETPISFLVFFFPTEIREIREESLPDRDSQDLEVLGTSLVPRYRWYRVEMKVFCSLIVNINREGTIIPFQDWTPHPFHLTHRKGHCCQCNHFSGNLLIQSPLPKNVSYFLSFSTLGNPLDGLGKEVLPFAWAWEGGE